MRAPSHRLAVAAILAFAGASMGATVWGFPVPPVPAEIQQTSVDRGYGINTFDLMESDCHVVALDTVDADGRVHPNAVDECD